ncbi:hypothetical protein P692DRAFT_20564285 [Suillus brevipes Sb2]|nr:hypothetical protein P692DRAFT_20564285 [Suillus brevipes Sb2]
MCGLPPGPYHGLQYYLSGTKHTSNEVLANQASCHEKLTLHEFIAFGNLVVAAACNESTFFVNTEHARSPFAIQESTFCCFRLAVRWESFQRMGTGNGMMSSESQILGMLLLTSSKA